MARYYAEIQGNRGKASRMGTPTSGMWAHVRGWDVGILVSLRPDPNDRANDMVEVRLTGGSNGHRSSKPLGIFRPSDLTS